MLSACAADVSSESPKPDQLAFQRFWVHRESLLKLGALRLDTLSAIDLSVPLPESALRRWCRLARSGKWTFLDWSHPVLRISGCAVSGGPVKLMENAA
jgi:hypothetical protein